MKGNFLKNYTYRTCHNRLDPELIFIVEEFSRDAIFYLFFFYFLKGFHIKEFVSKIITTEPVVAPKLVFFVEELSTDKILLFIFFRPPSFKGIFSLNPNYRTHNNCKNFVPSPFPS